MTDDLIDAILFIPSYPALAAMLAQVAPGMVEAGVITGFTATPAARSGDAALVYVRMPAPQAMQWRGTPGVTILAEAAYGPTSADEMIAAIQDDPEALALYRTVWPETADDGDGGAVTLPMLFGRIA
ncbi:MAG: hypothetical protein ACK4L4_07670 [Gemmobacter sp.]